MTQEWRHASSYGRRHTAFKNKSAELTGLGLLQITTVAVRADMNMHSCTAFRNGNYSPDSKTEWEKYVY